MADWPGQSFQPVARDAFCGLWRQFHQGMLNLRFCSGQTGQGSNPARAHRLFELERAVRQDELQTIIYHTRARLSVSLPWSVFYAGTPPGEPAAREALRIKPKFMRRSWSGRLPTRLKQCLDAAATSLGLVAPADVDGDTLLTTVRGLPTKGTVLLADGVTAVANGQTLTGAH